LTQEYQTIDPVGSLLTEHIRAWRLVEGEYRPWQADENGRWQSEQIAVSIGLEGVLATVYTREGQRQLHEGEIAEELARKDAELEELRRLLDDLRGKQREG